METTADDSTLSTADAPRFDLGSPSPIQGICFILFFFLFLKKTYVVILIFSSFLCVLNCAGEVNGKEPASKFDDSSPRLFGGIADFDSPSPTIGIVLNTRNVVFREKIISGSWDNFIFFIFL